MAKQMPESLRSVTNDHVRGILTQTLSPEEKVRTFIKVEKANAAPIKNTPQVTFENATQNTINTSSTTNNSIDKFNQYKTHAYLKIAPPNGISRNVTNVLAKKSENNVTTFTSTNIRRFSKLSIATDSEKELDDIVNFNLDSQHVVKPPTAAEKKQMEENK